MVIIFVQAGSIIAIDKKIESDQKAVPEKQSTVIIKQSEITQPAQTTLPDQPVTETKRAGEEINWQVISSGGSMNGTSDNYMLSGTVGQTSTGFGESDSYGLSHGFWQIFGGSCCNLAGDANDDDGVNVGDAVYMINYVFKSGPPPNCSDEGDANADCGLNVGDAVYLINYVFKSGPAPICGCVD